MGEQAHPRRDAITARIDFGVLFRRVALQTQARADNPYLPFPLAFSARGDILPNCPFPLSASVTAYKSAGGFDLQCDAAKCSALRIASQDSAAERNQRRPLWPSLPYLLA
jgi:hypothetical protein